MPPASRPQAVLFDLDGTLVDSAPDLAESLQVIRVRRGLPRLPFEELRPHASSGARGMLAAGLGIGTDHPEYGALRAEFLRNYETMMVERTHLFDGVPELLQALDDAGIRWGVVSNKFERYTRQICAHFGLTARACAVVGGDTTPHPKPAPDPLLHATREAGLDPLRCWYVGDDLRDIEAGRAAGMRTVAAAWGYCGAAADLASWRATLTCATPQALHEALTTAG